MFSLFYFALSFSFGQSLPLNTFTYNTQILGTSQSCTHEAQSWAKKFEQATGLKTQTAICRGEKRIKIQDEFYTFYSLGLTYLSHQRYVPYVATIGADGYGSMQRTPVYKNVAECQADQEFQVQLFEIHTTLKAVSVYCSEDRTAIDGRQLLNLEGFSSAPQAQPTKDLFRFSFSSMEKWNDEKRKQVLLFLKDYEIEITKQSPESLYYYRAKKPVPVSGETFIETYDADDCHAQLPLAQRIIDAAGSSQSLLWCLDTELQALWAPRTALAGIYAYPLVHYNSLKECLADVDFVLADSRYKNALGALCSNSYFEKRTYEILIFEKAFGL